MHKKSGEPSSKTQKSTFTPTTGKNNQRSKTNQLTDNRPESIAQRQLNAMANAGAQSNGRGPNLPTNNTGLPDHLKTGIEQLSGYSMDDVKVHYNSDKPAQLQAHAYAQGTNIHIGPGQEKHLPHEAWHVVQQKQGRVKPTTQLKGKVGVNDDAALEREADLMGAKALQNTSLIRATDQLTHASLENDMPVQRIGEEKYGVHKEESANEEDWEKVRLSLMAIKAKRSLTKNRIEKELITAPGMLNELYEEHKRSGTNKTRKKEIETFGKRTAMNTYPDQLEQGGANIPLAENPDFKISLQSQGLRLEGLIIYNNKEQVVATLLKGDAAYKAQENAGNNVPARQIYAKETPDQEQEYVKDNRGIMTRKFAYVEKSYHQFMEFLSTGKMIGRFQMVRKALGDADPLNTITRKMSAADFDRMKKDDYAGGIGNEHIGMLHQIGGSGIDQRGLSLSATPREDAVVSNRGESFRTPSGVKIKIDLSKIPQTTLLINHYAHGGTKDANSLNPDLLKYNRDAQGSYSLTNSVMKNRELLLEALDVGAIVDITFHGHRDIKITQDFNGGREDFLGQVKGTMNHKDFEAGYEDFFDDKNLKDTKEYKDGRQYAVGYRAGYELGHSIRVALANGSMQRNLNAILATTDSALTEKIQILNTHNTADNQAKFWKRLYAMRKKLSKIDDSDTVETRIVKAFLKEKIEAANEGQGIRSVAELRLPPMSVDYGEHLVRFVDNQKSDQDQEWYDINRIGLAHALANKPLKTELDAEFYSNT